MRPTILILICIAIATLQHCTAARAAESYYFDIEAGPAEATLNEWSKQSDYNIMFNFRILSGVRTKAVQGKMDPFIALRVMLGETHLYFDILERRTVSVLAREPFCDSVIANSYLPDLPPTPPCQARR